MATILSIQANIDSRIRNKTQPGSITRGEHADTETEILYEVRDRGCIVVDTATDLATVSADNTRIVMVRGFGFFRPLVTPSPADEISTYESADAGTLWEMALEVEQKENLLFVNEGEYVLKDGFRSEMIMFKPGVEEDECKIGLTDGGTEILLPDSENPFPADTWRIIRQDIVAHTADVTIYFRDFTGAFNVIIVKRLI